MNKTLKITGQLLCVLCLIVLAALLLSSRGYIKETPAYSGGVRVISNVSAEVDGKEQAVSLPHSFSGLSPRTPVTLRASLQVSENDCLYVKSVYAPLKVYADDRLIYQCGQPGSYPAFMKDPATTVTIVPLTGLSGEIALRFEYLSPCTRSSLSVQPPLSGQEAALSRYLLSSMAFSFMFSILEVICGVLLILVAIFITLFEPKGITMLWLGLFALSAGFWAFGECNYSSFFVSNPTVLYLVDFAGLFLMPVPLTQFCLSMVSFRNPKPLRLVETLYIGAVAAALVLQFSGAVAFSGSVYVFHLLVPVTLLVLSGSMLYEWLKNGSRTAKRFFVPMAVLTFFSLLEVINYWLRFTNVLSQLFQVGILLFVVMMGIIGGMYIRDGIRLKQIKQRLEFEVKLMDRDIADQKKRQAQLIENAAAVRAQRHDLRHQLAVIRAFSQADDNRQLSEYLDTLDAQLPEEPEGAYCENAAVNAIVSHYAGAAKRRGIELSLRLTVPADSGQITDSNLCVVFGNLLENGIEACERMREGHKFIRLASQLHYDILTVVMDNSFDGVVSRDSGGLLSSKRAEHGIGTASIAAVAERCGGGAEFEAKGTVFLSSVYVRI